MCKLFDHNQQVLETIHAYSYLHSRTLGLVVSARGLLLLVFLPDVEDQSMEFLVGVWAWWAAMRRLNFWSNNDFVATHTI